MRPPKKGDGFFAQTWPRVASLPWVFGKLVFAACSVSGSHARSVLRPTFGTAHLPDTSHLPARRQYRPVAAGNERSRRSKRSRWRVDAGLRVQEICPRALCAVWQSPGCNPYGSPEFASGLCRTRRQAPHSALPRRAAQGGGLVDPPQEGSRYAPLPDLQSRSLRPVEQLARLVPDLA